MKTIGSCFVVNSTKIWPRQQRKSCSFTTKKVVFIYVTAGDAGQTNGWWEAREQGALAAVREALPSAPMTISVASFNGHPVLRYTCRNSVSYFFRLPDGGPDGHG